MNWKMAIKALVNTKPKRGYGVLNELAIPPGWNTMQYLAAYGQVGWLFGAVSLIATSVAEVEWKLTNGPEDDAEEVTNHPLLTLLNKANPFQTRYELFLMLQTYRSLVGKGFIVLNYTNSTPTEMWLAPPQNMTIIPDKEKYIAGYKFKEGTQEIFFSPQEVIYIPSPNPLHPMDGMGVVQPIATDLQNEVYATRYTNKLFYNDAVPGFAIEIPELYTKEQREEYQIEWDERHRGWANARKTAFLWGGAKINTITMTNKDMDFEALRKLDRETILGAFHIPTSLMGLAEVGSRARAEADEYIFAKRVVKPALQSLKEAFNEQLCPLFGTDLKLDFENPIPANKELDDNSTRTSFQVGLITREEARVDLGYNAVPENGETLMIPFSSTPSITGQELSQEIEGGKGILQLKSRHSEEQLERRWNGYIAKTEAQEIPFKKILKDYWEDQEKVIIANLKSNPSAQSTLFGDEKENDNFVIRFKPLITMSVQSGWNDALSEFAKGIRKQAFDVLNLEALEWIATRSLSLATMVNGTTKEELRKILAAEFAAGSSIDTIVRKIREYYINGYERRAALVARTEVITASNKGANLLYKAEGVTKVQWYTALDERVCPDCEPLHNDVFPIDDGPRPALHPQCRCTILAYLGG